MPGAPGRMNEAIVFAMASLPLVTGAKGDYCGRRSVVGEKCGQLGGPGIVGPRRAELRTTLIGLSIWSSCGRSVGTPAGAPINASATAVTLFGTTGSAGKHKTSRRERRGPGYASFRF